MPLMAMREHRPTMGHWIEFAAWVAVSWALKPLPRRALVLLADAAGAFCYHVLRIRRKLVDANIAQALGDTHSLARRRAIARRSYQNSVLTFFEFLQPNPMFTPDWDSFARLEGIENARPFFGGRPALMVTGHLGNWEGMAALLERHDVRMVALAKPLHNPLVQRRVLAGRSRYPRLEILLTHASMKAVVDAVRAGKWVTFLADQDARRTGIFVDFFGRPASTAQGPALFAWKLGLPLLPIFCVREQAGSRPLSVIFCPPIIPDPEAPRDEEIRRLTGAHVRALEEVVRRHPEDYFWLHRRWKTRPKRQDRPPGDLDKK